MSTQPKHDYCPGDGQPCWTEGGGWRCGTSQCGRPKQVRIVEIGPDYEPPRPFTRVVNRGRKREPEGQSALPRFSPYNIPARPDPKAVQCPYCVRRPRNLRDHCRSQHPDKPEAR